MLFTICIGKNANGKLEVRSWKLENRGISSKKLL